jgi:hypothetical protein
MHQSLNGGDNPAYSRNSASCSDKYVLDLTSRGLLVAWKDACISSRKIDIGFSSTPGKCKYSIIIVHGIHRRDLSNGCKVRFARHASHLGSHLPEPRTEYGPHADHHHDDRREFNQ